jgi:uncharacterized protein YoxC
MVDVAALVIAGAFVVLVGCLVPMILQVKRTVGQSERMLIRLNHELPGLLKDLKGTNENIRELTDQARLGIDRATIFFQAMGEVGQTVNHVHQAVRGKGGALMVGFTSLLAGLKAATSSVKHRVHKEGGTSYGD